MRKRFLCLVALLLVPALALSEGMRLRTVSCFAGSDAASEAYVEILRAYEAESGNSVTDVSSSSDEEWKAAVLSDFAAGNEPDVLFYFAASADSAYILDRVVPLSEINAAYPQLNLPENPALREADGQVYAIPARPYWEGLFVNTELFEHYHIALPTDWDSFVAAIEGFRAVGIVPIAVSLSDIPHYLAEFAMLACCTLEEQAARPADIAQVPAAWVEAMALIRELYTLGAFPEDTLSTTEAASTQLFLDGRAAMQLDGSWFAASLTVEDQARFTVLPFPTRVDRAETAYIGGVSMGFYLTRRAWNNEAKRDAAVALLARLTSADSLRKLGGVTYAPSMAAQAEALTAAENRMTSPVQDAMNKEARELWLLTCIPRVASGAITPEQCWQTVLALNPFDDAGSPMAK